MALFTGARQNELASLTTDAIFKAGDGTWVFEVSNEVLERKPKTPAGTRLIPIHPFLLNDLNIAGFSDKMKKAGQNRLFPELPHSRDSYGKAVSRWYNERFKVQLNIEGKEYHTFRKTFITHCRHKRLPDDSLKQIVGHSRGDDVNSQHYTAAFDPKRLCDEVISKVSFHEELDLSHLRDSRFVI